MFNCYNFMVPEQRHFWKSAFEIEMASREYDSRWLQMQRKEVQSHKPRLAGFFSFLKASLAALGNLAR